MRMELKTRVFKLVEEDERYASLPILAQVMGISTSQIYRVQNGDRGINGKFIVGAVKAFPDKTLDELFYIEEEGG